MLQEDVTEPATSELTSPIVFAYKKDSSVQFSVDYRRLDGVAICSCYLTPFMDECINS